jgi:Fe-S cluster biogenesis protein NfuA
MKTLEEIQTMLDEKVNVLLGQHRGRVDIVGIETHPEDESIRAARVKMSGGCQGCAGAKATLRSIVTNCIQEFDNSIEYVVDDTDHSDKTNAFFKE